MDKPAKPTKAAPFKKGVSGNPAGRPKKPVAGAARLREMLATKAEAVMELVIEQAMAGDIAAAKLILQRYPQTEFIIPAINSLRHRQISDLLAQAGLKAHVFDHSYGAGVGRLVMSAADVVILASGTATLEAMLVKKPMVVVYKLHWLTYWIVRLLSRAKYISLPNLLADAPLVPEFVQNEATPEAIAKATIKTLEDNSYRQQTMVKFTQLHQSLQANASLTAAHAIQKLLER